MPNKIFAQLPTPGQTIGTTESKYVVIEEIGIGHFSHTYLCEDIWGSEVVAKAFKPKGMINEVRRRWLQESDFLKQLRHPNLTYIFDAFENDNIFYIIVERCHTTLEEVITDLNEETRLKWFPIIARDLLRGLSFIHENGIVHKDIHPGNILVSANSNHELDQSASSFVCFKIGDLGVANFEDLIGQTGSVMANWMRPPELYDESLGPADKRIDIYHIGLTLLGVILGQVVTADEGQTLAGSPRQLAESLKTVYGDALAKSLRRRVAFRTSSPFELWQDIIR